MIIFKLAMKSMVSRRLVTTLTVLSIALSTTLLLIVERVRVGARASFVGAISQTDLIIGSRGGSLPLLLNSVFHIGSPATNMKYSTFKQIQADSKTAWAVPIVMGDSHRGYRVVGTSQDFFSHFQARRSQKLTFASGNVSDQTFTAVIGSNVAARLKYKVGGFLALSHGIGEVSFHSHEDRPFLITGILEPTGSPVDRSIYIPLAGTEAIHADWHDGAPPRREDAISAQDLAGRTFEVDEISAVFVGVKSKGDILNLQRQWSSFRDEPLTAVIPGVALDELWEGLGYGEEALRLVAVFVVLVGLTGMLVSVYNSLSERRREMAILRSLGATPSVIFGLLLAEAALLVGGGAAFGLLLTRVFLTVLQPMIVNQFGLYLTLDSFTSVELIYFSLILVSGVLLGAVPAWRAYRNSLSDGLVIRL